MNSKLIKQSIMMGAFTLIAILLVVCLANWKTIKRKMNSSNQPTTQETVTAVEDDEAQGGQIGHNLAGFLEDDAFFDESEYKPDVLVETGIKVSIMMDSIGQDLRVMIIDNMGNLATGTEFTIAVEGDGLYSDTDRDGIIYVEHLREGDYFVTLNQEEGYIVPATKTMIKISKDIEYKAISDVAYLVLTEDQVDITADDTADKLALGEADGTESIEIDTYESDGKIGIDVSRYNEDIDWDKVAEAGIDFAIIRCGYRGASSGSLVLDSKFRENMMGAIKAGIPVGVYFFSQATSVTEAIEEASMVIDQCKLYMLDYPIFIDSESAGGAGRADDLDVSTRTAITKAFCETITNSGYEAGVYASKNWWNDNLDAEKLSLYHSWLAQYSEKPDYEGYFDFWQYTSKGSVDGIENRVDLNVCYK